jgi:ferrochelatase
MAEQTIMNGIRRHHFGFRTRQDGPVQANGYDAILLVSFGGPEQPDDVIPFLKNVLRGRNVPEERMLEVAEHYQHFGGVSPINQQCRDLLDALRVELDQHGIKLPLYWGNRNWHPLLPDVFKTMQQDGVKKVLSLVTSGFSCYSGCRQYRENLYSARELIEAPEMQIDKIRVFYNHPDFVSVNAENLRQAWQKVLPDDGHHLPHVAFTAHSIPMSMATTSDYEQQLQESCRLVADAAGIPQDHWKLVYQSRSGRPQDPWLEPDICDHIRDLHGHGVDKLVIAPIGFLSDHMEVLFDLDEEAAVVCNELNITMERSATPGVHPRFVTMLRKLIQERTADAPKECTGQFGPNHDVCPENCCPAPVRRRPVQTPVQGSD